MNHECYCIALRKISRRLTAIYDEALAPFGINVSQFSHLRTIRRRQPLSLSDLAVALDLDRSTVGRNTKVLQRMGLLAVVPSEDLRESALALTGTAESLLKAAGPAWDAVQARVEEHIDATELDRLLGDLNAM